MLDPLNFVTVVFLVLVLDSGAILHKRVNQRKVSSLLKLPWAALQVAIQKRKLGVSFICHDVLTTLLSFHDLLQHLFCQ